MEKGFIHFGCGLSAPEGWLNFDASPTLRLQRIPVIGRLTRGRNFPDSVHYGDIVKGLPIADSSAVAVYCSHVLEHLSLDGFEHALTNTYKILKPGGVFRLVLPDLEYLVDSYLQDDSEQAAVRFMKNTGMATEKKASGLLGFITDWLGNSRHLWLWDYPALHAYLELAGFVEIRRAEYGDSELREFDTVEDPERWKGSVGVECRRPES